MLDSMFVRMVVLYNWILTWRSSLKIDGRPLMHNSDRSASLVANVEIVNSHHIEGEDVAPMFNHLSTLICSCNYGLTSCVTPCSHIQSLYEYSQDTTR